MNLIKTLLLLSLISLIPGQLIRFDLFGSSGAITLTDILVLTTDATFLIYTLTLKRKLNFPKFIITPALLFTLAATASTILALTRFTLDQIVVASMFLVRFLAYFFIVPVTINAIEKEKIYNWIYSLLIIENIFLLLGFMQLILFPDFSFLVAYGWDPHQTRITSTLLDPNFAGLIFVQMLAFFLLLFLENKKKIYIVLSTLTFIAIILTFSRSTYLASLAAITVIGILKSPKILIVSLVLFVASFLLVPQVKSRIVGALSFDETSQARVESWQKARTIFAKNPLFGVGFNTYRYAQNYYGFFERDERLGGHSGAGSDSSLLLVAATTGLFGFSFFAFLLISITKALTYGKKTILSLATLATFVALLVHSQFVNSFFFPQIMLVLWFLIGLNLKENNK